MRKKGGIFSYGIIASSFIVLLGFFFAFANYNYSPEYIKDDGNLGVEKSWLIPVKAEELPDEAKVTFAIAGDMMLDRNVWHYFKDEGLTHIFDNFDKTILTDTDFTVLNLEGPISKDGIDDDWNSGSMVFNFPPESIDVLKHLGIDAVSLANNHTQNAGSSGLLNTKEMLDDAGIMHFGKQVGFNWDSVVRLDTTIPVSLIGIDALAEYDESYLLEAIEKEKKDGQFVIVMPHWGVEYRVSHHPSQELLAKKMIHAGANMIVGSHPHVVEDYETIENVPVVYSLGNFVFDQMFSDETQEGLIITGEITKEKITINFIPTRQKKIYLFKMSESNAEDLILNTLKSDARTIELDR